MTRIRAALLAEGSSDRGLVGILEQLCARKGCENLQIDRGDERISVFEVGHAVAPRIAKLLEFDAGYNLLFIHRDADSDDPSPRFSEIELAISSQSTSPAYVRVVPIQELEAWLLVDEDAILRQFGKPPKSLALGLPSPKQLEQRARPKELLKAALARAMIKKRNAAPKPLADRKFNLLRARLLENLDIDGPVTQLSAWQQLLSDIDRALESLGHTSPP